VSSRPSSQMTTPIREDSNSKETEALRNEKSKTAAKVDRAAFARSRAVPLIHTFEGTPCPFASLRLRYGSSDFFLARDFVKAFKDAGCDVACRELRTEGAILILALGISIRRRSWIFCASIGENFWEGGLWPSNPFPLDNTPFHRSSIYLKPIGSVVIFPPLKLVDNRRCSPRTIKAAARVSSIYYSSELRDLRKVLLKFRHDT